jgi:flagellar biosynthesis GTPase FlhF
MRMKMFAAETFEAAKAMIFAEMGADAVILSEREIDGGVEVRAAVDKMGGVGMVPNEPLFLRDARGGGHGRGSETHCSAACAMRCSGTVPLSASQIVWLLKAQGASSI